MSVSIIPGLKATVISPLGNSSANDRVKPSTPHLLAQYGPTSGAVDSPIGTKVYYNTTFIFSINGTKDRTMLCIPPRLTARTEANSSGVILVSGAF